MASYSMTFDAVAEARPGSAWRHRWHRSWPAYEAWFRARGGDSGPSRAACAAALDEHMPELVPVHRKLTRLAGDSDRAARFLSTWCPPPYLGGCSLAARAESGEVRLVRNYDLSPDLNEGLLLRTEWTGMPVMGMVEFLWGLSDGVNGAGLCIALAFGGRGDVAEGFGITTILRYALETCATVAQALEVLARVPSHMAYNITLADRHGTTAAVELQPGGGARRMPQAIATNHQHGPEAATGLGSTGSEERRQHLEKLFSQEVPLDALSDFFLREPLFQRNYAAGFGTLFTAVYDPCAGGLTLRWRDQAWRQRVDRFEEGRRQIVYVDHVALAAPRSGTSEDALSALAALRPFLPPAQSRMLDRWLRTCRAATPNWASLGEVFRA